jgi:hypothetical protein
MTLSGAGRSTRSLPTRACAVPAVRLTARMLARVKDLIMVSVSL